MKNINNRFYIHKKFLISLIYSVILGIAFVQNLILLQQEQVEMLIMRIFGHLDIGGILYIIPMISFILYNLYLLFCLVDYIYLDLKKHSSYIFTRTDKRNKWFLNKCLNLFLYTVSFYILHFIVVIIIGFLYKLEINNLSVFIIIKIFFIVVLFNYITVIMVNILNLYIKPIHSYLLVVIINILNLFTSGYIYTFASEFIDYIVIFPVSQIIISWHEGILPLVQRNEYFQFYIEGFSFYYSTLYLIIIIVIVMIIGNKKINKMDIM